MTVKKTFISNGEVCIGVFPKELENAEFNIYNIGWHRLDTEAVKDYPLINWEYMGKTYQKYEIPLKHFTKINKEEEDSNISLMTIRDFYCILNKVPRSNKEWLNKLTLE